MLILFGSVHIASASTFSIGAIPAPALSDGLALFAGVATFGGAIFGYAIGWSSYAADYTRRQPADTAPRRVFTYAYLGVAIPCVLLEILGVLLTSINGGADLVFGSALPGRIFANSIGTGRLAGLVIGLLALSTIANNVPNDYSFALSTQVLGLRVKRWILTLVGAAL